MITTTARLRYVLLCLLFAQMPIMALAQDRPHLTIAGGPTMLVGASKVNAGFQFSEGCSWSRFYAGVAMSYDPYGYKTVPVAADLRWYPGYTRRFFASGQIGTSGMFVGKSAEELNLKTNRYPAGFFMEAGLGFNLPLIAHHRLDFVLVYSRKNVKRIRELEYPCACLFNPKEEIRESNQYNRVVAKLLLSFLRN